MSARTYITTFSTAIAIAASLFALSADVAWAWGHPGFHVNALRSGTLAQRPEGVRPPPLMHGRLAQGPWPER